ncbi:MAG: hypothetical protein GX102_07575 [Porphyromonadaceae bacterium]|nr:hypothetical protein [Porphyromonadaceae bacterium]
MILWESVYIYALAAITRNSSYRDSNKISGFTFSQMSNLMTATGLKVQLMKNAGFRFDEILQTSTVPFNHIIDYIENICVLTRDF